jgi:PAS domain S-box-containing protein
VTDPAGLITSWNEAAERLYQWRADEVLGRHAADVLLGTPGSPGACAALTRLLAHGYSEESCELRRRDGTTFVAHVTVCVLRDETGAVRGFVGVSTDLTERARTIGELLSRNEVLQTVFDNVPVMIAFSDSSGRMLLLNRECERTLGWSSEEARAGDLVAHVVIDPAELERARRHIRNPPDGWVDFEIRHRDGRQLQTSWANVLLENGTSVGIGIDVTERRRAEADRDRLHAQVVRSQEMLEALSRHLLDVLETERRHVARELHDEIGQVLTTINLRLETLRKRLGADAAAAIDDSVTMVGHAIEQVRSLSLDLRPASLDFLGLDVALRSFLGRQAGTVALELTSDLGDRRLAPPLETVCFRLVQEAVTNVLRHAKATRCEITLTTSGDELAVGVRDDGVGFDYDLVRTGGMRGDRFGLVSMEERVQLYGGRIAIRTSQGAGTVIQARFPLRGAAR